MSYEPLALSSALAAAVGDDPTLVAELRGAFFDSAERHVAVLRRADTAEDWREGALRLKGLAASFGAARLIELADQAAASRPGDRDVLDAMERVMVLLKLD